MPSRQPAGLPALRTLIHCTCLQSPFLSSRFLLKVKSDELCLSPCVRVFLLYCSDCLLAAPTRLSAEPLPLKRAVELALAHSTTAAAANADEQRVFASYREARNQYIPQFMLGSGWESPGDTR